jgi:nicotinate-nucleotide adenylyltransferase
MKLGILGGTFNPVHYGHLRIAEEVREKFGLEKIIFIPSGTPPFKYDTSELIGPEDRFEMVKLAIKTNPFFEISDIEIKRKGISYTVDTLEYLRKEYPEEELYFIAGVDAVLDLPKWHRPERILKLADFIVVTRPGVPLQGLQDLMLFFCKPDAVTYTTKKEELLRFINQETEEFIFKPFYFTRVSAISISGSFIRSLIRAGRSIKYLLPEEVEYYIIKNRILDYNKLTQEVKG